MTHCAMLISVMVMLFDHISLRIGMKCFAGVEGLVCARKYLSCSIVRRSNSVFPA